MSEMKNTPGPWEKDSRWPNCIVSQKALPGALSLARVAEIHFASEADWNLIQAAPDLLEACKKFLATWHRAGPLGSHQFEKFDVVVQMADAAIAKAERSPSDDRRCQE